MKSATAILAMVLIGCADAPVRPVEAQSGAAADAGTPPEAPPPGPPEMAPTPYTAEQIRRATAVGRTYEYRVESPGEPVVWVVMKFTRVVNTDADVARSVLNEQGVRVGAEETSLVTWEELRSHAEFPKSAVQITDEQITVPIGTFDCLKYTVTMTPGAEGDQLTFYFAKTMPGAPVLWFEQKGGKRVKTSTLAKYLPGG